jgi:cellulose synthase/poly-beta-1,6-N-acetylglucosamine synthase-like glycosyltransferase
MSSWWILYTIDGFFFFIVAFTVLYFLVFSVAALMKHRNEVKRAKVQNRFIVLIPSYQNGQTIRNTTRSILGQTYPQRLFDVVVISDHESDLTNMQLAQLPITLLTPNFDQSSKAKSLQYAIFNLPKFKIYDAVIILDAGNIVKPDFLDEVNDAFTSAGTKAMQTRRLSANRDTAFARLDSIFEEVNNTIFRRGHQVMGLSAALNGSGCVFDFQWFKTNIMKIRTATDVEKALDALLMRENIYVDYFEDIHVFDEKKRTLKDFNRQRSKWIHTQIHALLNNIRFLPSAILNRHYDHIDKILQWMLIPRTILIGIITIMSIILPFIYMTLAIKWWVAGAVVLFAFALATPDYLVDKNWDHDFTMAPLVTIGGLLNIFKAGKSEAIERVNTASQWVKKQKDDRKKKKR